MSRCCCPCSRKAAKGIDRGGVRGSRDLIRRGGGEEGLTSARNYAYMTDNSCGGIDRGRARRVRLCKNSVKCPPAGPRGQGRKGRSEPFRAGSGVEGGRRRRRRRRRRERPVAETGDRGV